jgi:putative intracellular protease/amidase
MRERVLMVVSAANELRLRDGSSLPTGYWASEVLEPYDVLTAAGLEVVVATPGARRPTPDERSVSGQHAALHDAVERVEGLRAPQSLSQQEDVGDYAAVVLPGGHGPMADLYADPELGRILRTAVTDGVPVAAICHGPAGFLAAAQDPDATWCFTGTRMTAFTDAEEGERAGQLVWSLEQQLRDLGAKLDVGERFAEHVVVDGLLVTGQNPASARPAANALLEILGR